MTQYKLLLLHIIQSTKSHYRFVLVGLAICLTTALDKHLLTDRWPRQNLFKLSPDCFVFLCKTKLLKQKVNVKQTRPTNI